MTNPPAQGADRIPVFGKAHPGVEYHSRPSVYALLARGDGRIAIMRVDDRAFLPGGGAHPEESWEETIRREVIEEMGWSIGPPDRIAHAVEYLQPNEERTGTRMEATFVRAQPGRPVAEPVEPDHLLDWIDPRDAAEILTHRSHAWIVSEEANRLHP